MKTYNTFMSEASGGEFPKKFKRFTRNDWDGWAGTEKMPDGSEPLIYVTERNNFSVTYIIGGDDTDSDGFNLYCQIDDFDTGKSEFSEQFFTSPASIKPVFKKLKQNMDEAKSFKEAERIVKRYL